MKWDWGKYNNTVFIFDVETEELLFEFDNDYLPRYFGKYGGLYRVTLPNSKTDKHPFGQKVIVVRAFTFDKSYYSKFETGHKAPKIVQKCWRMLQLDRLFE